MHTFSRFARSSSGRAAAAGAATTGTVALQPTAHARAHIVPAREHGSGSGARVDDDWLLVKGGDEMLLFRPFEADEVDSCLQDVTDMLLGSKGRRAPLVAVREIGFNSSDESTSEGSNADAVIELAEPLPFTPPVFGQLSDSSAEQLHSFLSITGKLLKRPGMQAEIVSAMLEDEEVCRVMLGQSENLEQYLQSVGVTPYLLPPAAAAAATNEGVSEGSGIDLVGAFVNAIATAVERTGSALSTLGGWLRRRLNLQYKPEAAGQEGKDSAPKSKGPNVVMGAVMVLAVAVFCMLVTRRPMGMRKVFKVFRRG